MTRLICHHCGRIAIPVVRDRADREISGYYCLVCGRLGPGQIRRVDP